MKNRRNFQKRAWQFFLSLSLFSIAILIFSNGVSADGWDPGSLKGTGLTSRPLFSILLTVIDWAITLVGILAVIIFIYGGFIYLTSQGENDKIEQAKKIILYAIVGVIVSILGLVAVTTINSIINGGAGGTGSGPGSGPSSSAGTDMGGGTEAPIKDPINMRDPAGGYQQQPYVRKAEGGGGSPLPVSPDMMQ